MGRRPRRKANPITAAHFDLLKQFGRSSMQKKATARMREELWTMCCHGAKLPVVPLEDCKAAWKDYITGESRYSGLAVNGDIDPNYVSVGFTYQRRTTAAHTTRTEALLKRLLKIYRRTFRDHDAFLRRMETLCWEVEGRKKPVEIEIVQPEDPA